MYFPPVIAPGWRNCTAEHRENQDERTSPTLRSQDQVVPGAEVQYILDPGFTAAQHCFRRGRCRRDRLRSGRAEDRHRGHVEGRAGGGGPRYLHPGGPARAETLARRCTVSDENPVPVLSMKS